MTEKPLITVGDLAKKSGVTVRTLQYYDKCGILKPGSYSEGGRRMYSCQDSLKLQQILFLKALGFSLEAIRNHLLPSSSPEEMTDLLRRQKQMMTEQIKHLKQGIKLLDQTLDEIESGQTADLDHLFAIVGALVQKNPYAFMLRHMAKEDIAYYAEQVDKNQNLEKLNRQLARLTTQLMELYEAKTAPGSEPCQNLARQWWNIVLELTDGDQNRIEEMFAKGSDPSNWPAENKDLRHAMELLGQALEIYFAGHGIRMPEVED